MGKKVREERERGKRGKKRIHTLGGVLGLGWLEAKKKKMRDNRKRF